MRVVLVWLSLIASGAARADVHELIDPSLDRMTVSDLAVILGVGACLLWGVGCWLPNLRQGAPGSGPPGK